MNYKKVLGFLFLRPAFSSRNITSLALVLLFFVIYVLAGGRVSWVPKVSRGSSFGTVSVAAPQPKVTGDVIVMPPAPPITEAARAAEDRMTELKRRLDRIPVQRPEESGR